MCIIENALAFTVFPNFERSACFSMMAIRQPFKSGIFSVTKLLPQASLRRTQAPLKHVLSGR
jgi:hypothetical protein